jgi:serine/threonine protein kinase
LSGKQAVKEGETVSTDPTAASGAEDSDDATHTFAVPVAGEGVEIGFHNEISAAAPGAEIGPYKIVRQLGEGGMGAVYLASHLHPIRREVALKIIKPGMDSRQAISRFESERQTLALMDHANIARVFDAGATASGLPFFVTELVNGIPITRYCDSKRLTVKDRIARFIPVCRAIQHAHQKGVIHRDLKPSNILVAEQEGKPVPNVIDFGLAKALAWLESDATMLTNFGTVVGTLDYMSPEQADPGRSDVDTRGDVYSLGAVLYELLTGSTPLDRERLNRAGYVEILKQICDEDTPPPSTRLRRSATSVEIADLRQSDPARLTRILNGELDWILMKALDKDRTRRYETVNGLARDLERYLAGEPVEAAPPSAAYRMRKFVRRHVVAFSFAASVLAVLIAFVVAVTIDARRISRERDRANRITQFMVGIFRVADSTHTRGNSITAREILDNSAREISSSLGGEPQVQADLLSAMAQSYDGLGLYSRARELLAKVIDIQRRTLGPRDRRALASMSFRRCHPIG